MQKKQNIPMKILLNVSMKKKDRIRDKFSHSGDVFASVELFNYQKKGNLS